MIIQKQYQAICILKKIFDENQNKILLKMIKLETNTLRLRFQVDLIRKQLIVFKFNISF